MRKKVWKSCVALSVTLTLMLQGAGVVSAVEMDDTYAQEQEEQDVGSTEEALEELPTEISVDITTEEPITEEDLVQDTESETPEQQETTEEIVDQQETTEEETVEQQESEEALNLDNEMASEEMETEETLLADAPKGISVTGNEEINWFENTVSAVVVTVQADNKGKSDAWRDIQDVLDYAGDNATDTKPYKIVFPEGTYNISQSLHIYSNTYLSMEGAKIVRCFTEGCMLRNGFVKDSFKGYNGHQNILLEGGEWDGNAYNKTYGYTKSSHFSNIRFGHAKNVTMKGVTVSNNVSAHCVEFGGVDGVVVEGCTFRDQLNYKEKDTGEYNGNEALQIDVIHSADVFADYKKFDDTITKNVTVTGNTFKNVMRGVGSHTGVLGKYYEDIVITDNTFTDIKQQAIIATNYVRAKISNNTMTDVGAGVEFKYMTQKGTSFHKPVSGSITLIRDCASVISDNRITTCKTAEFPEPEGIRVMGWNLTSKKGEVPKGNYFIEGIKVTGNHVNANGYGIRLINVRKSTLSENEIVVGKDKKGKYVTSSGIYLSDSQRTTIERNKITKPSENGIMINSGSKNNTIRGNEIKGAKGFGIQVYNKSTANSVIDNKISDTTGCGIQVSTSSSAKLEKNTITKSGKEGIKIYKKSSGEIKNNTIKTSGSNGIAISNGSKNITVLGNTISSSKKSGISVYDASSQNIKLTKNIIDASKEHGILVNKKSNAAISKNTITNSTKNGICLTAASGTVKIAENTIKTCTCHGIGATESTVSIKNNTLVDNKKYGISLSNKGKVKEISDNTMCNKGNREIYVASNVKSSVKNLDAVKVKDVKSSATVVEGTATDKTQVKVLVGTKKLGSQKLKGKKQFSVKIPKQKKDTTLRVESIDKYKNVAYRTVKVK